MQLCKRECGNKACCLNKHNYSDKVLKKVALQNYDTCRGYKEYEPERDFTKKLKDISIKQFEALTNLKICTINVYLCRAEFRHIISKRINGKKMFINVVKDDIKRIKELSEGRKGQMYRIDKRKRNKYNRITRLTELI